MGTNAVGAMVVAGPEGFVKNQYRKFNIRSTDITPGDDFGMMREVMQRRFSRLIKEHEKPDQAAVETEADDEDAGHAGFPAWPDVILIDGGQGQMSAVRAILDELGIEDRVDGDRRRQGRRPRGRARALLRAGARLVLAAGARSRALFRAAAARRGAPLRHRLAPRAPQEGDDQATRSTRSAASARAASARCCMHFGTAKAVGRAAMEDLMAVEGISESMARLVYNHFHEN